MSHSHTQYSPQFKHHVLTMYAQSEPRPSLRSLARDYDIQGGDKVIRNWLHMWDGTPNSLKRQAGQGRHRILKPREVRACITEKIKALNRRPKAVHYTDLLQGHLAKTHKKVSLRTIQRIGKEEARIKVKQTVKRTVQECNFTHTSQSTQRISF